jgi:FAD-dependent urate hydroxylase
MIDIATAIVGAGPYGLSIAAYLKARGQRYELFGVPLESWREHMPDGMVLKSEPFASNLWDPGRRYTLERYCRAHGLDYQPAREPLSLAQFLGYAEWFRRSAVGESTNAKIRRIAPDGARFRLELEDGSERTATQVVIATGHLGFRRVPGELAALAAPHLLHSADIKDVRRFRGRDVTVIGAGQSALETAALAREAGATARVLVRDRQVLWNERPVARSLLARIRAPESGLATGWRSLAVAELPRVFRRFPVEKRHRFVAQNWGPAGSWWLRDRIEGQIEILLEHRLVAARPADGRVQITIESPRGRREMLTDHVVAGTGYEVDVDRLTCLDGDLRARIGRERRAPALRANFETSVPGLYIVGIAAAPTFGPVMRFMFGAKHAAAIVAHSLR